MIGERGSVLIVGVGGQGVVLASAVVAEVALRSGFDVKQSEVHGMSQRGGSVTSHLRYGPVVNSPLIEPGTADALVAFEWNEGLRWLPYLRPGAPLIVNLQRLVPPGACRDRQSGHSDYPVLAVEGLARLVGDLRACDALAIAAKAGSPKTVNSVLLGVLAPLLPFPEATWLEVLTAYAPRGTATINERAFLAGRALRYPAETERLAEATDDGPWTMDHGRRRSMVHRPSSIVHAPASAQLEIVESWCKGKACEICVRACPEYCLTIGPNDRVAVTKPDACTGCRLCELLCPDFAIVVHRIGRGVGAKHSGRSDECTRRTVPNASPLQSVTQAQETVTHAQERR